MCAKKAPLACYDLFHRPNDTEAKLLVRLGRLGFGVEIALQQGRTSLLHRSTLPERIYLDASVLMPAIIRGHPYRATYIAAVQRLRQAQERVGNATTVLVLEAFLNEIISHRSKAEEIVREEGLEDPEILAKYVLYAGGTENTNVFIGAYANVVNSEKTSIRFADFLEKEAPYRNELRLAGFLAENLGIQTASSEIKPERCAAFTEALLSSYSADSGGYESKPRVLIEHEALQLAWLDEDLRAGTRTVFVTADSRLRRVAVGEVLGTVSNALISSLGFIQLVDLLIGIDAEPQSLARVLWAVEACDEQAQLRNYFVDLALRHYEPAEARTMSEVLDDIVGEADKEAKKIGVRIGSRDAAARGAGFKLMDKFENSFFEKMAQILRAQRN